MKCIHLLAIVLGCSLLGALSSQLLNHQTQAQAPAQAPAPRYQLFQGRYMVGHAETQGVFRLDTATGKVDGYFAGNDSNGKFQEGFTPVHVP